jgi:hypothetical protein
MAYEESTVVKDHPETWVKERIEDFIARNEVNRLALDGEVIYDEPLVGFARGNDPLFRRLKRVIGKFHCTPLEWVKLAPEEKPPRDLRASDLRVVAWVLPITEKTRSETRMEVKVTSRRWAHTRLYGEDCNQALRSYLVSLLKEEGYFALAPFQSRFRSCPVSEQVFYQVEAQPRGICVQLVGASRPLCRRARNLRPLRWTDYPQGKGHALRQRHNQSPREANTTTLSEKGGLLPLSSPGNVYGVRPPMPRGRHHGEGAR